VSRTVARSLETRVLDGFDDASFGPEEWERLLPRGDLHVGHLTWHFQRAWWESLGRGELLLIAAERDGEVVALAPFYAESGMISFAGTCFEFDYLDFVGDVSDSAVLDSLLLAALECVPNFRGFRLHFVSDRSRTGEYLQAAAARIGLSCYDEEDMLAPEIDLVTHRDAVMAYANRKSALKLERYFSRQGALEVHHLRDGEEILPHLPDFFRQHLARYATAENPSRFHYVKARRLFERLSVVAAETGWLRFIRIDWEGRPIAFQYGHAYGGRYFYGPSCFDPNLARRSPGKVLLRHLLLAAIEEGAHTLDFGTGHQLFKLALATEITHVHTYGLYPRNPNRSR
jgi:CelD/BcsL family acetyltransferase involved in cellulose biosynthesis